MAAKRRLDGLARLTVRVGRVMAGWLGGGRRLGAALLASVGMAVLAALLALSLPDDGPRSTPAGLRSPAAALPAPLPPAPELADLRPAADELPPAPPAAEPAPANSPAEPTPASSSDEPAEPARGPAAAAEPLGRDPGGHAADARDIERPRLAARTGERPPPTPEPRRETITYRVAAGDTLSDLARRFGVSVRTIVRANGLAESELLTVGQELVILPVSGVRYVVREGDTLLDLAEEYGVIPDEIVAVNGLAEPYRLRAGQELVIPEVAPEKVAAPIVPQPGAAALQPSSVVVAPGDTLAAIAHRQGVSLESLRWSNPSLPSADQLAVGQRLLVPPVEGVLHRVRPGDTLSGVAALYGASAAEIVRANALAEPYLLTVDGLLVVPGGRPPAPVPAAALAPTPAPRPTPRPTATPVRPVAAQAPARPAPAPATAPVAQPPAAQSDVGARIVAVAQQYRGYRYTWGGASPATGFDCSGYVWYVFRQAGVAIPRDLWGQYNSGPRIGRGALQPGDVVFFQNTYKPGLSHDGIYVGGDRFIHAASENLGVIVSSLGERYWAARYLGATRPW